MSNNIFLHPGGSEYGRDSYEHMACFEAAPPPSIEVNWRVGFPRMATANSFKEFITDGKRTYEVEKGKNYITLRDLETGEVMRLTNFRSVSEVRFSEDGRTIFAKDDDGTTKEFITDEENAYEAIRNKDNATLLG